ncbi:MAG TPA: MopE-related protein [Candidatus Polarisedimenticolaceae bacterium]
MTPPFLAAVGCFALSFGASAAEITVEDRVAAQRAIEQVYWSRRIWPAENPLPKPPLAAVLSDAAIRARVEDYLRKSSALATRWQRPITGEQLQAEMDRMARDSRAPETLRALFEALGNDPARIAETLARPTLVDRLFREWSAGDAIGRSPDASFELEVPSFAYTLPALASGACEPDTWIGTGGNVPTGRISHVAVWTGSELIVWGGSTGTSHVQAGGRYNPSTDTWVPTPIGVLTPQGREDATAVWTGTEMIVWGGYGRNSPYYLNTGGRYNPTTETWTPTAMGAGLPAGRSRHSAVWTGSEMIVWGGEIGATSYANSGGRYDPSTNTWAATSTVGAPIQRTLHTAVWTGSEMIVWGGRSTASVYERSGGRYDPTTDTWIATSSAAGAPAARAFHTAVWTGSRMIVWGGFNGPNLNSGARYDPASDTWTATSTGANLPSARYAHVAAWTGSEMLVWGGEVASNTATNSGGGYDPVLDAWTPTSTGQGTPTARRSHTAVWTGRELIVWGGSGHTNTGGRYAPSTDSWIPTSTAASVPQERYGQSAVWTGSEMIVWGGQGSSVLGNGGRFDPATANWVPTSSGANAPSLRTDHAAVWSGTEMIVWGGYADWPVAEVLATGARYDPMTDAWRPVPIDAAPTARRAHSAVWTGSEMVVWGGRDSAYVPSNSGARYNPSTDAWIPTSTAAGVPAPRHAHSAVWTGSEMIVWGGEDADFGHYLDSGGRYDPAGDSWTPTATGANVPVARRYHTAVWTGSEMIVWGGRGTPYPNVELGDGGCYSPDADTWTPVSSGANAPSARHDHTAIWTGSEMIVWGGSLDGAPYYSNGGGRYDPATDAWAPISTAANIPPGRSEHTVVWTGSTMIVWGGTAGGAHPLNSGGEYCACPDGRLLYRDADGDGFGDSGDSLPSCDGSIRPGYVSAPADCDDGDASVHPGANEVCNGRDDNCGGGVDETAAGVDVDADLVAGACDNCPYDANAPQSDGDGDDEGDACDLDDGVIWEWREAKDLVQWQAEQGATSWNLYLGDLGVLKATGVYTQEPGSNALADRRCGLTSTSETEASEPTPGEVAFSLVTGVASGGEGSLGSGTLGPRPNDHPCP